MGDALVSFGYVTTTFVVWDKDEPQVREKLRAAQRVIDGRGFA